MLDLPKLKQQIKKTNLFSADEKVELFASLDTFSEPDLSKLSSLIADFDSTHAALTLKYLEAITLKVKTYATKAAKSDPSGASRDAFAQAVSQLEKGLAQIKAQP